MNELSSCPLCSPLFSVLSPIPMGTGAKAESPPPGLQKPQNGFSDPFWVLADTAFAPRGAVM